MSNGSGRGPQWLAMCTIPHIAVSWPSQYATCRLKMLQPSQLYGRTWTFSWLNMEWTKSIFKVSWPPVPKQTGMLFQSYTEVEMHLRRWWTKRWIVFSIGRSPWRNIPRLISVKTCNFHIEYMPAKEECEIDGGGRDKVYGNSSMVDVTGAATEQALPWLELWLAFWHFRYRQWGRFMDLVNLYLPDPFLYRSLFMVQLHWFRPYSNSDHMGIARSKWRWTSGNAIL